MITKKYSKDGKKCQVTFELPKDIDSTEVYLCGNFTNWVGEKMKHEENGGFSLSMTLLAKKNYQFRYKLDGERWENDMQADSQIENPYGSEDSVLEL